MSSDWKNVLKTQHNELKKIQIMDSVNDNRVNSDIEKLLARPSSSRSMVQAAKAPPAPTTPINDSAYPPAANYESSDEDPLYGDIYGAEVISPSPSKKSTKPLVQNPLATPSVVGPDPNKAPEAADRFARAKVNMLTKQLEEGLELRKKMEEQTRDLQRQLKTERDENKSLNKRINLLETEVRKMNGGDRRRHSDIGTRAHRGDNIAADGNGGGVDQSVVDNMNDIINDLKKQVETSERIAKQSESSVKTKDSQLRRAAETISRMKNQLNEAQLQLSGGMIGDKARVEALEARVKVLEKQRAELLEGFRKQMKLIDILKRQKVHTEAARLLNFTEEEFMKTLDWKI